MKEGSERYIVAATQSRGELPDLWRPRQHDRDPG